LGLDYLDNSFTSAGIRLQVPFQFPNFTPEDIKTPSRKVINLSAARLSAQRGGNADDDVPVPVMSATYSTLSLAVSAGCPGFKPCSHTVPSDRSVILLRVAEWQMAVCVDKPDFGSSQQ
jgi:hypothetical protein